MCKGTSTTSAEAGDIEPSAPSFQVRPIKLRDAIRWVLRDDSDIDGVFAEVCHALQRGDEGCITLVLPARRYHMSPVRSYVALEEIDPHGGRALIRTRRLLPRRSDPKYLKTLRAFVAKYSPATGSEAPYQLEERLARLKISLPPQLCDPCPCLPPFDLARQLGIQFNLGVEEAAAAAILYKLDGKRPEFVISRDWIRAETQLSQQRRAPAKPLPVKVTNTEEMAAVFRASRQSEEVGGAPGALEERQTTTLTAFIAAGKGEETRALSNNRRDRQILAWLVALHQEQPPARPNLNAGAIQKRWNKELRGVPHNILLNSILTILRSAEECKAMRGEPGRRNQPRTLTELKLSSN
jgi:hypothetical protein